MDFLFFLVIVVLIFVIGIGFMGYKVGVLIPILIVLAVIVFILRAMAIRKKNSY